MTTLPPAKVPRKASLRRAILFIVALLGIFAFVRRHVACAAERTIIVTLGWPHVGPFAAACGAPVEVAEEHDRPSLNETGEHGCARDGVAAAEFAIAAVLVGLHFGGVGAMRVSADRGRDAVRHVRFEHLD